MFVKRLVAAVSVALIATPALADTIGVYPVQTGAETARFNRGVATLNLETPTGAVQITPLPFDHGHVVFGVGVYNKGSQPANFGVENVNATIGAEAVPALSVDELAKRAKTRAMWTQIAVAALAGAAAAAASTAHTTDSYHTTVATPHGVYSWNTTYRDNSIGVLGATAAVAGGAAGVAGIQNRLDYTLANLSNDGIQTTTVEANASYGGEIVLEKPRGAAKVPYDVHVTLAWNGASYPFVFRVTKKGVDIPPPYTNVPTAAAVPVPINPAQVTPTPAVIVPSGGVPAPVITKTSAPAAAATEPAKPAVLTKS